MSHVLELYRVHTCESIDISIDINIYISLKLFLGKPLSPSHTSDDSQYLD